MAQVGLRPSHSAVIWGRLAWLGRYGHQPASTLLDLPMSDVDALIREVVALVQLEGESTRKQETAMGGGG